MFVDGIPPNVRWQELKDHFSVIGEVKFASVSVDRGTGRSKGHGLVQYVSRELAEEAIASMRDHPLEGVTLFVRKDVQERGRRDQSGGDGHGRDGTMPGDWECGRCFVNNFARRHECFKCGAPKADARPSSGGRAPWDEPREWRRGAGQGASADEDEVIELLSARDVMRRAKDYESADAVREELLAKGVKLDDSSRTFWLGVEGRVVAGWSRAFDDSAEAGDDFVQEIVDALKQRDALRHARDFENADAIRDELTADGIKINDRLKTFWLMRGVPESIAQDRSGGRSEEGAARGGARRGRASVPWVGLDTDATLAEHGIDGAMVMAALADRDAARANKDFHVADRIQNHLRSDLHLYMDDKERTWSTTPQVKRRDFGNSHSHRGGGGRGGFGGGGGRGKRSREYDDNEMW